MKNSTNLLPNSGKQQFFYPNRLGRVIFLAMEEILGDEGVKTILDLVNLTEYIDNYPSNNQNLGFPFEHIGRIQVGLDKAYGLRASRGLAVRIGRACFNYGLRQFGTELGLTDLAFRLLPLQKKIKNGSEAFAALFNTSTDLSVRLERDERFIYWRIEHCPLCWERHSETPCCHLVVGILQEALFWVSGGKYYEVEEMKCIACGERTCSIVIDQTPLG